MEGRVSACRGPASPRRATHAGRRRTDDYAAAFALALDRSAPPRAAQQWARAVFEDAPPLLRWVVLFGWRFFLGLRLQPLDATDQILGWKLEPGAAGTDAVTLAADSPLLRAENIVAADDTVVLWVTVVHFEDRAGRLLWTVASALHHLVIPYLLGRAARFRTGDETPFADPDSRT